MKNQTKEELASEKINKKGHRRGGSQIPHVEHFPTRKIEISQLMFNEIFINPKIEKLNKLGIEQ